MIAMKNRFIIILTVIALILAIGWHRQLSGSRLRLQR